jgi:hypothetical protein
MGALGPTPAHADEGWIFGSVVCAGDAALVRFTDRDADEGPQFDAAPAPYTERFSHATNDNPSRCQLRDGRLVILHQQMGNDVLPYGENGGVPTQAFSLSIDGRVVYSATLSDRTREQSDLVIVFDRGALIECRTQEGDWDTLHEIPQQCTQLSEPLSGERDMQRDERPYYWLASATPDFRARCTSFLQPQEIRISPPHNWPTFVPTEPRNAVVIPSENSLNTEHFDIDNDGRVDTPSKVTGENQYFDGTFWMLPPTGRQPTQQQIEDTSRAVMEQRASGPRLAGWRIYSGDQTGFHEPRYTRLTPFTLDGQTYFEATWAVSWADPRVLLLRPTPEGLLDQICAFEMHD